MSVPLKQGWLVKKGKVLKMWKKRWFSLHENKLCYSKKKNEKITESIDLSLLKSVCNVPECKDKHALKLMFSNSQTLVYATNSQSECDEWISELNNVLHHSENVPDQNDNKTNKYSLDDFDLIRVLGRGSYGKVQLVRCKLNNTLYAMKSVSKKQIIESDIVNLIMQEKDTLMHLNHPFLVSALCTFQTEQKLFIVMDYVNGGELFGRLREEGKFTEKRVALYAAEIALGLGALHAQGFIFRDLKPENILFDSSGHIKITDFGLTKPNMNDGNTTNTFCGTPEYIAPEILQRVPYTKNADWWSYGVLVYEMLTGLPPFYHENVHKLYRMILHNEVKYPSHLSNDAKSLIMFLLDRNPKTRLGSLNDLDDIKEHPFFESINWDDVENKKVKPQWIPKFINETDTSNFSKEFTREDAGVSYEDNVLSKQNQYAFQGFSIMHSNL